MARLKKLATISTEFGIPKKKLAELGIVDVCLNIDTKLFIDPTLLTGSSHPEIANSGAETYKERFETIIKLLRASKQKQDPAWKAAKKYFQFSEINWTCLGYGNSTYGSGFGEDLTERTLETASQIIEMGVEDIDLFMVLALFEEGIGPDRISDMTTNIIIKNLVNFTNQANNDLKLPTFSQKTRHGNLLLPKNPFSNNPLLFTPTDIVRDLPIACSWSEIYKVTHENEQLRDRVNKNIGNIWSRITREEKSNIRKTILKNKYAFEAMLSIIKNSKAKPYDFKNDVNGEVFWSGLDKNIKTQFPLDLNSFSNTPLDIEKTGIVVEKILKQFQDLIENKGIWKELWTEEGTPRKEKAAQRLFFVIACAYCEANNLDISPETDSGNGPVDFKVSKGFLGKVVIEIKLSTGKVVHGYEKQLEIYKKAENTDRGIFLLIDVGDLKNKYTEIQKIRDQALKNKESASLIWYVDATQRASASKRK